MDNVVNLVLVTWEVDADKRPSSPQVICRRGVRAPQEEGQLVSEALTQTRPRPVIQLFCRDPPRCRSGTPCCPFLSPTLSPSKSSMVLRSRPSLLALLNSRNSPQNEMPFVRSSRSRGSSDVRRSIGTRSSGRPTIPRPGVRRPEAR